MGPSNIDSIKDMNDDTKYDNPFVISEVNAKLHN